MGGGGVNVGAISLAITIATLIAYVAAWLAASSKGDMFGKLDSFLGDGRALEAFLAAVMITWGLQVAWSPEALYQSLALRDYYWTISNRLIALPMFLAGLISAIGICLNIFGRSICRWFRMTSALLSLFIFLFMLANMLQESGGYGSSSPWYIWASVVCARLFLLGLRNLPPPGAHEQSAWPPQRP